MQLLFYHTITYKEGNKGEVMGKSKEKYVKENRASDISILKFNRNK